jgi:hypothetical protein
VGSSILVFLVGAVAAGVAGAVYAVNKSDKGFRDDNSAE